VGCGRVHQIGHHHHHADDQRNQNQDGDTSFL
jgi:hypothetical protein